MAIATDRPTLNPPASVSSWFGPAGRLGSGAALSGGALAVLVGLDGSPGWRVLRVAAVIVLTAVIVTGSRLERWRGPLVVVMGIPAVAIALGFAPHLAKSGPLPIRVAAVVLTVAGVGLVIGGVVVMTRQHALLIRVIEGFGVLVVTALVALVVAPAVAATNVPHARLGATPASVDLTAVDVTLTTDDGVSLAAWYVPSSNRAAIVLRHGAGSTRSNVLDHAAVIARAGFGVLMVDARGHGDSGGRAMDFGWHGDADIAAATEYLATRPDVDPGRIGAVGLSMGGEEVLGASGSNDLVRAVVAEGATARSAADEAWLSDRFGVRGAVQEQLERVQDWVTDVLTDASVPTASRAAVESSSARYLLVTAGKAPDEGFSAAHVAAGAPDRVEVWTVPGAGHTGGLDTAPDDWATRVTDFLSGALLSD